MLLSGKPLANAIKDELREVVSDMKNSGQNVKLAVIQVGNDAASSVYIKNKKAVCEYIGIDFVFYNIPDNIEKDWVYNYLLNTIDNLNSDESVNGILVQLPLPRFIDEQMVLSKINPMKDVDGFHAINVGNMVIGNKSLLPCTAKGIINILHNHNIEIAGRECVVVGRSNIVGKPTAALLLQNDGTVTVCHSKTKNLKDICKRADILVCAVGKPKFFNHEYIKDGAIVIDVGIHKQEDGKLCGDVDFDDVKDIVSAITPVPGGVGQLTTAMLASNCVEAANMQ